MSTIFRKTLICLIAVFAMSAVAATAASAETESEQQFFQNAKKEQPKLKGFTSKEEVSKLTVPSTGTTVECKKDTDVGKLVGRESVEKVVVTFKECENPAKTCEVHSVVGTVKEVNGTVKTLALKGELGEVAESEAASKVGLLLEGETSNVFVTLESSVAGCLPVNPSTVEGGVVGEVKPLTLSKTDKVEFLLSGTAQKIKVLERSFALHCANAPKATRECKEDAKFEPKLSAFGKPATFESKDENTFEEELEVNAGV
jgi:hypothetical protein